jgi:hypothetical protein
VRERFEAGGEYALDNDQIVRYAGLLDEAEHLLVATYGSDSPKLSGVTEVHHARRDAARHLAAVEVVLGGAGKQPERLRELAASDVDKRIDRLQGAANRTQVVTSLLAFVLALVALGTSLWPWVSQKLASWSDWMRADLPLLPTFTWAQFFGGLLVGLLAAGIAALIGRFMSRSSSAPAKSPVR